MSDRPESDVKATKPGATKAKVAKVKTKVAAKAHVTSGGDDTKKARNGAKFLAGVVLLYIVYLVVTGQMATFVEALSNVDRSWIVGACLCYVMYFVFGVAAYVVAVWLDPDSPVGVRDLMSVEASGVFFGNLTPMMAGAVPAQIVRLTRTGLDAGEASATQFTRFIMFQFGVVLFAALAIVGKFEFFLETYGNIVILNLVVFGMHFFQLLGLFVVCLCPGFVKRLGNWGIRFMDRRGWLNDRAHWDDMVNNQVDEFSAAFKNAARHLSSMGVTLLVTMLQLACLYTVPWFVLNAFGRTGDFWACLAAGSMVQMVSSAVPLPGGTGGAESGFALFYGPLFGSTATAGYLVWRIVTFFAPTILAAPLLGLRSDNGESIRHRCDRLMGRARTASFSPAGKGHAPKRPSGFHGAGMSGATAARLARRGSAGHAAAPKPGHKKTTFSSDASELAVEKVVEDSQGDQGAKGDPEKGE